MQPNQYSDNQLHITFKFAPRHGLHLHATNLEMVRPKSLESLDKGLRSVEDVATENHMDWHTGTNVYDTTLSSLTLLS